MSEHVNTPTARSGAPKHARAFLKLLDPSADTHSFRTFDDVKGRNDPSLCRKFNAKLNSIAETLHSLNEKGAGVFVVINDGGQTKAEISRVRAVFADTDGAPLEPLLDGLQPHIVVQSSPGNWHAYWSVDHFPRDMFPVYQEAIATKYGTDPAVKDLPRVMRLPGFMHNKGDPFMVKITQFARELPRYTAQQIADGLSLGLPAASTSSAVWGAGVAGEDDLGANLPVRQQWSIQEAAEMLQFIDPACGRDTWRAVGFAIADSFGEAGRKLFISWSAGELFQQVRQ